MPDVLLTAQKGRLGGIVGDIDSYPASEPQRFLARPLSNESANFPPPVGYVWEQVTFSGEVNGEHFTTLLQVVRPTDPERSSGIVVMEPWHRAGYWTLHSKVQGYLAREGHTAAIVLANHDVLETFIRPQNPQMFADLHLPDTEFIDSEVMAQAGAFLRLGAVPGVAVRRLVLGGQSTVAYWVRRYITQEHHIGEINGHKIFDGYFPAQSALSSPLGTIEDIDVPVVELQGESELIRSFARGGTSAAFRRDDGDNYRLYEVPGMPHVCTRHGASASRTATMNCLSSNWSDFPMFDVFHIGLDNLIAWVDRAIPAPSVPRINTREGGRVIERDEYGNAIGGLRTSYFDVPTVTIHATCGETPADLRNGVRCDFFAWDEPLSEATLQALYPSPEDYVSRVEQTLDKYVTARWYLAADAAAMMDSVRKIQLY